MELMKFWFFYKDVEPNTMKVNFLSHLRPNSLLNGEKQEIKLMSVLFNVCKVKPLKRLCNYHVTISLLFDQNNAVIVSKLGSRRTFSDTFCERSIRHNKSLCPVCVSIKIKSATKMPIRKNWYYTHFIGAHSLTNVSHMIEICDKKHFYLGWGVEV